MNLFFFQDTRKGKIKTESGKWIPATFKSNRYAQWKEKSKIDQDDDADEETDTTPKKGKCHTSSFIFLKF